MPLVMIDLVLEEVELGHLEMLVEYPQTVGQQGVRKQLLETPIER